MIAHLSGTLLEKTPPYLLIDVNGVGYEVEAPLGVFSDLPEIGHEVEIVIYHHFSQDAQTLYGFASLAERDLFRKLLKISGIGTKLALNILSSVSGEELAHHVSVGDVAALVRLPGIGKKTAERMIIELKDKLKDMSIGGTGIIAKGAAAATDPTSVAGSALASLGFKPTEVARMISLVAKTGMKAEEIIRKALKTRIK